MVDNLFLWKSIETFAILSHSLQEFILWRNLRQNFVSGVGLQLLPIYIKAVFPKCGL